MAGYLGSVPVPQATQHRESFTCTEGQTSFATAGYTAQFVDVYLNGSHLSPADFTATNGSDVVLAVAASADDVCDIISYTPFEVANQTFTGDFKVDGTTFNVDSTNSRIGIGTASPATVLHIEGTGSQDVDLRRTGTLSNNNRIGQIMFRNDADSVASVNAFRESAEDDAYLTLNTQPSGGSLTERLRISADGAISTPTAGTSNVRLGVNAGDSIVSGANYNVAIGDEAGTSLTNGALNNVLVGYQAGTLVAAGDNNVLLGYQAGDAITSASNNIAIGKNALSAEDTHDQNIAIGSNALAIQDAGTDGNNVAIGHNVGVALTDGINNTIVGSIAAAALTTADDCVIIGFAAGGGATLTGHDSVLIGRDAGHDLTSGGQNVCIGRNAGDKSSSAANCVSIGYNSGGGQMSGNNTFVGSEAATSSVAANTVIIGNEAGYSANHANNRNSVIIGRRAGYTSDPESSNSYGNVLVGANAAYSLTTGYANCVVGGNGSGGANPAGYSLNTAVGNSFFGAGSGASMTSGSNNVIIGGYNGNEDGLDIRTSDSNIVLATGLGVMGLHINANGAAAIHGVASDAVRLQVSRADADGAGAVINATNSDAANSGNFALQTSLAGTNQNNTNCAHLKSTTQNVASFQLSGNGASSFTSDSRLKKNIETTRDGYLEDLDRLRVVKYNWHCDEEGYQKELGLIAQEVQQVFPGMVHVNNETLNGIDDTLMLKTSVLPMMLLKAIQELSAKNDALETRITALEGA